MPTGRRTAGGFAYLLLLFAIAVIGVAAAGTVSVGAIAQRRNAERQLLVIGQEFQRALRSYTGAPPGTPAAQAQGPHRLEDLLKDPRAPGVKRHLRRIYDDPLTGHDTWGIVTNARGEIVGIYSLAGGRPLKQAGFDPEFARFENAESYSDWSFGFAPPPPAGTLKPTP